MFSSENKSATNTLTKTSHSISEIMFHIKAILSENYLVRF